VQYKDKAKNHVRPGRITTRDYTADGRKQNITLYT